MKKIKIIVCSLLWTVALWSQGGTWTWVHGDTIQSNGNFGTKGVPSATNQPPPRYQCAYWTDKERNFWVFGGTISSSTFSIGTDMWKYNPYTNIWTWMSGTNTPNSVGNYGTKGIPSVNNFPCSRGYGANCWTDSSGMLWLFGGSNHLGANLDDLWKYNPYTNEWTWVRGSNIFVSTADPISYGTMNVPKNTNTPGPRSECKSGWTIGNELWQFGGGSLDQSSFAILYNDLWKYSIANDVWIWEGGGNGSMPDGNYGTKGVANPNNIPPARWSYTKWKSGNKLYLFAGAKETTGNYVNLNDIWNYDLSSNIWTWVGGSKDTNNLGTNSPTTCINNASLFPSSRLENQTVQNTGCFKSYWTYGGFDNTFNLFSDLWLYKLDINEWTRVSGTTQLNFMGNYGQKGVPSPNNLPPAKAGIGIWTDTLNNLYIFSGFRKSLDPTTGGYKLLNDMWKFTPNTSCFNYNLSGKLLNSISKTRLCNNDYAELTLNSTPDSIRVIPMTGVTINASKTSIVFQPTTMTSYKVLAYGNACGGYIDSTLFTLKVGKEYKNVYTKSICTGDTFMGKSATGIYKDTFLTSTGCDSIQIIDLTVSKYKELTIDTAICEDDTYLGRNVAGVFRDTFKLTSSCDSIRILKLAIIPKNYPDVNTTVCEGISIEGHSTSGIYIDTLISSKGCDSIRKLNLTVIPSARTSITQTLCSGKIYYKYKKEGVYIDTFKGFNGCDSIRTLTLHIIPKPIKHIYTCINPGGIQYFFSQLITKEGIYVDSTAFKDDCDTIFVNHVKLITPVVSKDIKYYVACKYLALGNGRIFFKDTIFPDTIRSFQGCDSIYIMSNVRVKKVTYLEPIKKEFCDTFVFKGNKYKIPLSFFDTIKSIEPPYCDSIVWKIYFEKLEIPKISILSPMGNIVTKGEKLNLSVEGNSTRVRWFNSDTTRTISIVPYYNYTYGVRGWNESNCQDTASIYIEVEERVDLDIPRAFSPNGDGNNDEFTPNANGKYEILLFEIFNRWGEKVFEGTTLNTKWDGTYKGEPQPSEIYVYNIIYKKNRKIFERKGSVSLLR